jgi:hypothetical protein
VQLVAGCIHVICRRCAKREEAKVLDKRGVVCPFCARQCASTADELLLDIGTLAALHEQQQQQRLVSGEVETVPDCDVCGDDPATK